MKKRLTVTAVAASVITVGLTVWRILSVPAVLESIGGTLPVVSLCVTAALLLALLFIGRLPRDGRFAFGPRASRAIGFGALASGVSLMVFTVFSVGDFRADGTFPYPANLNTTATDTVLFYALTALGLLAGGYLLLLGVRCLVDRRVPMGSARFGSLLPILWMWVRIIRYEVSYVSSLQTARHWQDLLLLLFEMLFFLLLAKTLSRTGDRPPQWLSGVALCAGVTAAVGCLCRGWLALAGNAEGLAVCGLVTAADLGIAILAFAVAFGWMTATQSGQEEDEEGEPLPPLPVDPLEDEDEEERPLLLIDDVFRPFDADDDDLFAIDEATRRPIQLEEMIGHLANRADDGEN